MEDSKDDKNQKIIFVFSSPFFQQQVDSMDKQ